MNKPLLLSFCVVGLLVLACQRQGQVHTGAPGPSTTALEPDEVADPAADQAVDALPMKYEVRRYYLGLHKELFVEPQMAQGLDTLLRKYDLKGLLSVGNMNGFGDSRHYRYEVAFTSVVPSPQSPALWLVKGKTRYKQVVRSFSGTLEWQQLYRLAVKSAPDDDYAAWAGEEVRPEPPRYSVSGRFHFLESNGGQLLGQVNADFTLESSKKAALEYKRSLVGSPACGANLLFEGQRLNAAGQPSRAVVWGENFIRYASQITSQMTMGLRGPEITPAYVARGWNEYYQHDEWWADVPAAGSENALWPTSSPTE